MNTIPIRASFEAARKFVERTRLTKEAKDERRRDLLGLPLADMGCETAIVEGIGWLCRAQDCSKSNDGGVARHYSLVSGWGSSYPETTGYIIPTLLDYAKQHDDNLVRNRARRMLEWLTSLQFPDGSFQAGAVETPHKVPVTFNTGQILLGLASGVREFGEYYIRPTQQAADWLVETQDPDGCWRKFPTPHADPGEKTYETHVAWGLLEAARVLPERPYASAALANVRWALKCQRENGWLDHCCLTDPSRPLTHTLGYALRGILETYRFSKDETFLSAGKKMADGLLQSLCQDGFLPGRILPDWRGAVKWSCLTGSVQIAICWMLLYQETGNRRYFDAARLATRFVRRTMKREGSPELRGGVKGSFPITGDYGRYQYLNWACKFLIDACALELAISGGSSLPYQP